MAYSDNIAFNMTNLYNYIRILVSTHHSSVWNLIILILTCRRTKIDGFPCKWIFPGWYIPEISTKKLHHIYLAQSFHLELITCE